MNHALSLLSRRNLQANHSAALRSGGRHHGLALVVAIAAGTVGLAACGDPEHGEELVAAQGRASAPEPPADATGSDPLDEVLVVVPKLAPDGGSSEVRATAICGGGEPMSGEPPGCSLRGVLHHAAEGGLETEVPAVVDRMQLVFPLSAELTEGPFRFWFTVSAGGSERRYPPEPGAFFEVGTVPSDAPVIDLSSLDLVAVSSPDSELSIPFGAETSELGHQSAPEQMPEGPSSVAIDNEGRVFVADVAKQRIAVVENASLRAGETVELGVGQSVAAPLDGSFDIAVTSGGRLFAVGSRVGDQVFELDPATGETVARLDLPYGMPAQLRSVGDAVYAWVGFGQWFPIAAPPGEEASFGSTPVSEAPMATGEIVKTEAFSEESLAVSTGKASTILKFATGVRGGDPFFSTRLGGDLVVALPVWSDSASAVLVLRLGEQLQVVTSRVLPKPRLEAATRHAGVVWDPAREAVVVLGGDDDVLRLGYYDVTD